VFFIKFPNCTAFRENYPVIIFLLFKGGRRERMEGVMI